ncbi:hypothetical protein J8273_3240 [Carpediemonas membranifera]|uniref:Uncharacterized protein n=1 Tax=Carpediemonas membranifera TaxID=201153 RepID=A0A8J6BX54_9EUKA|nr:hypothetical protein J8273_3240 [Carpediemonas membranifera]|eukprot:KAG9393111.1 hypothetical protein J8273_3240 [Carpediemonas membranifera]
MLMSESKSDVHTEKRAALPKQRVYTNIDSLLREVSEELDKIPVLKPPPQSELEDLAEIVDEVKMEACVRLNAAGTVLQGITHDILPAFEAKLKEQIASVEESIYKLTLQMERQIKTTHRLLTWQDEVADVVIREQTRLADAVEILEHGSDKSVEEALPALQAEVEAAKKAVADLSPDPALAIPQDMADALVGNDEDITRLTSVIKTLNSTFGVDWIDDRSRMRGQGQSRLTPRIGLTPATPQQGTATPYARQLPVGSLRLTSTNLSRVHTRR